MSSTAVAPSDRDAKAAELVLKQERAITEILNSAARLVGSYSAYREFRRKVDRPIHDRLLNLEASVDFLALVQAELAELSKP